MNLLSRKSKQNLLKNNPVQKELLTNKIMAYIHLMPENKNNNKNNKKIGDLVQNDAINQNKTINTKHVVLDQPQNEIQTKNNLNKNNKKRNIEINLPVFNAQQQHINNINKTNKNNQNEKEIQQINQNNTNNQNNQVSISFLYLLLFFLFFIFFLFYFYCFFFLY